MSNLLIVGDRHMEYVSHQELDAALRRLAASVDVLWPRTDELSAVDLAAVDGVWVIPGSPYRDAGAVEHVIGWALDHETPLLGTCSGFQYTALTLVARRGDGGRPGHAEEDPGAADPMIAPLACRLDGETRTVTCRPGTRMAEICGPQPFAGTHFCGFGLAPAWASRLEACGAVIAADAPDAGVEAFELPGHPFFLATMFQPQVGASGPGPLRPLVTAFADAVVTPRRA